MCKLKQLFTQHQALEASKKVFCSTCKLAYTTHSFFPTNAKLDSYAKTYLCNKWLVDEAKYRSSRIKTLKHSNSVRCHQKHSDKKLYNSGSARKAQLNFVFFDRKIRSRERKRRRCELWRRERERVRACATLFKNGEWLRESPLMKSSSIPTLMLEVQK